ncbi:uncharacterized protein [Henckelia pumila]|uniref:uncharacterized protein n=1 Tax=Henckelia pumila TaxID=405737 RepID=UPI003C6DCCA1
MELFRVLKVRNFLYHYEQCSGQLINNAKSVIITANDCSEAKKGLYYSITGFGEGQFPLHCLGAPLYLGPRKILYFDHIIANANRRLQGWESKLLSFGSRLVLIKKNSLDCLKESVSPCFGKRSWLMKIRQRAEKEIGWVIVEGELHFWFDSWSPDGPLASRCPIQGLPNRMVKWFCHGREWNLERLLSVVPADAEAQIMEVHIHPSDVDRAIWIPTPNGRFSVKSAWEFVRNKDHSNGWFIGLLKAVNWSGFDHVANQWGLNPRSSRKITIRMVCWIPLSVGYFKLNSDGCSKLGGVSSIGGIVRDHSGQPIIAFHESIGQGSNTRAELMEILKGLQICRLFNLFPLWLEVDSMVALKIIEAKNTSWSLSPILSRILHILNVSIVRKSHIFREANAAADELANMGINSGSVLYPDDIHGKLKGICRLDRIGLPYIRLSLNSTTSIICLLFLFCIDLIVS